MSNPLRSQVLGLYRRLMRLGRTWQAVEEHNTQTERQYIIEESRRLFKENKNVKKEEEVAEHVREAEARMTMAEHYRNPYPRPVNLPQRSYAKKEGKKAGKAVERFTDLSKPIYMKSLDDTKRQKQK